MLGIALGLNYARIVGENEQRFVSKGAPLLRFSKSFKKLRFKPSWMSILIPKTQSSITEKMATAPSN